MITPSSLSARTILALLALGAAHTFGADPAEIEVQVRQQTLRGKVLAHDDEAFWLMGRDGRLEKLPIGDVGEFRQVSSRFQAYSAAELRDQLRHRSLSGMRRQRRGAKVCRTV
jgi:hypothetical protein